MKSTVTVWAFSLFLGVAAGHGVSVPSAPVPPVLIPLQGGAIPVEAIPSPLQEILRALPPPESPLKTFEIDFPFMA